MDRVSIWEHEGKVVELGGNAPFELHAPGILWLVEEGSVDIFSVDQGNGRQSMPRQYLYTAETGSALFGFDLEGKGKTATLLAVGSGGTKLRELAVLRVHELAQNPEALPEILSLSEGFVASLAAAKEHKARPQVNVVLKPGETYDVDEGKRAAPQSGLVWVYTKSGEATFSDKEHLLIDAREVPIPLAQGLWVKSLSEDLRLEVADTKTVAERGQIVAGLELLREVFLAWATHEARLETEAEGQRLERKETAERQMREHGMASLVSVIEGESDDIALMGGDDPLLTACRVIGAEQDIAFNEPPKWETESRASDPLQAICRASRVRYRRVTLRGDWDKTDSGPILAFNNATSAPVALIPRGRRYQLLDPDSQKSTPLTKELVAGLAEEAYVFYRPFPDRSIDARDLLWQAVDDTRQDIRMVLSLALMAGLLGLLMPIATAQMVGNVIPGAVPQQIVVLLAALVAVQLGILLFDLARAFALVRVEGKSNASLEGAVIDRLLSLPVPFFRKYPVGELTMRSNSINLARALLSGAATVSLLAGVFSAVNLLLMVYYNWRLALLAFAVFLVGAGVNIWLAIPALRLERERLEVQGTIGSLVFQLISGIAKLRVAGAEGRAFAVWAERFKDQKKIDYAQRSYQNAMTVFNDLLPLLSSLALFATAGYLVTSGRPINTATFIAFNVAFGTFFASSVQLSNTLTTVLNTRPTIERAAPILQSIPEVEATKPDPGELGGRISAENINFRYDEDGPLILDNCTFRADPGEFIALVGPSGSGKSTSLRLLLGFEEAEVGTIYYDDQELASIDVSGVRSQIGVVLQSSKLTSGTIFENIIGSSPLTQDDAWEAAEMAGIADDIKAMPMGMHTVVAEGGSTVSGGQQQRLLIARALVRKPRIVFFDEATSALDNASQEQVSESLENLHATRVVIAHRLSTIRHADRIYVIERGRIVESGPFDDLLAADGLFAELVKRQMA